MTTLSYIETRFRRLSPTARQTLGIGPERTTDPRDSDEAMTRLVHSWLTDYWENYYWDHEDAE
jgi:hypothetical protein